jgi:hypothetical protein
VSYSTYILGKNALFNFDMLNGLEMFNARLRRDRCLASWRILHVDGFENGPWLLAHDGNISHFHFDFETHPGSITSDGVHEWTNIGGFQVRVQKQ